MDTQAKSITKAVAEGLLALRERIAAAHVPDAKRDESITVATWNRLRQPATREAGRGWREVRARRSRATNIRELGKRPRQSASIRYLAEIIRHFDLVSIVELRDDLGDLERILEILGPHWRAVFTAPLLDRGGNRERAAYLYDARYVEHTGLASQAQAPRTKLGEQYLARIGWWRPPFLASFRAGGADLLLLTAHIRWGHGEEARQEELQLLADWVKTELAEDPYAKPRELVVLGDFNVPDVESPLFHALTSRGLMIPKALLGTHGTNLAQNKRYDQILHLPSTPGAFTDRGGVVDFYTGGGLHALYPRGIDEVRFTHEMSDHLPLWIELAPGTSTARLKSVAQRAASARVETAAEAASATPTAVAHAKRRELVGAGDG